MHRSHNHIESCCNEDITTCVLGYHALAVSLGQYLTYAEFEWHKWFHVPSRHGWNLQDLEAWLVGVVGHAAPVRGVVRKYPDLGLEHAQTVV